MVGWTLGSYRVVAKVGEGGMGAVYLAEHPVLGRKAAIKVLLPGFSTRSELVARFFREARATAQLRHPALVDVFDFGQLPDGSAYIVMDYLEGESLAARIERCGRLRVRDTAEIARQIAAGVGAAHAAGIVHRDLKPDNLFLVPDPERPGCDRVKVLDFGVAKLAAVEGDTPARTRTGVVLGTPLYMSPEQCRGHGNVDQRSDIYALGCIIYTMLTGAPPFPYGGVGEAMAAHLHEASRPLRAVRPDVPAPLEALVARMLAKPAGQRPGSMDEVIAALQPLVAAGAAALDPAAAFRTSPTMVLADARSVPLARAAPSRGAPGPLGAAPPSAAPPRLRPEPPVPGRALAVRRSGPHEPPPRTHRPIAAPPGKAAAAPALASDLDPHAAPRSPAPGSSTTFGSASSERLDLGDDEGLPALRSRRLPLAVGLGVAIGLAGALAFLVGPARIGPTAPTALVAGEAKGGADPQPAKLVTPVVTPLPKPLVTSLPVPTPAAGVDRPPPARLEEVEETLADAAWGTDVEEAPPDDEPASGAIAIDRHRTHAGAAASGARARAARRPQGAREAGETVVIYVVNPQEGTQVTLDGAPVGLPIRLPRDEREHLLRFVSPTTRPEALTVRADQDKTIHLENRPPLFLE